ncbi:transcription factor TFIIF complex alpha subunit Tfg1 [Pyrenophora tritici-repentis]|nr:Transcription factor TFIIF complex alpha protein [Pyrenophora tritici-repentis]KAI1527826.1 transcription factor TFIIF complex alpha subunit Tfg1 [Pyrenophora tritici-repentis]KAI1545213.1 transcription factor TFIIF complex alpha subunit Tfg1 [Pyrenophora tritici-repentis]KAI1563367.1 transcription factor TFIIF complex alpha subunit Tfg1 [Pyrenophora tritici-repentis]KAI1587216.1 transcription factor TFIIF complex alpha subunit Tfg1 [Pyrenophora tritici-repentis]
MNGNMNGNPPSVAPAAPVAANGQPVRRRRPRPQADVLRKPRRPLQNITKPLVSLSQMNEAKKTVPTAENGARSKEELKQEFINQGAHVFPLIVSRKNLKELRHHVMRLQSKSHVDIQDEKQFAPPIKLHRRDPRAPPSGVGSHYEEEDTREDMEETKERERIELQKEERRKVREENQAKIAPTGTKKPPAFHKKTEQKYRPDDTPEAKKRQLLRYEETLPWHLEDYENKQTWVGTYESEMSETHVMLSTTKPGNIQTAIQLAPMERWYRFNVKNKVKAGSDDMDKLVTKLESGGPRFFAELERRQAQRVKAEDEAKLWSGVRTRVGGGADDEGRIKRERNDDDMGGFVKREADADDIDFNLEEDFADDEEGLNGLFEGEEQDVKEAAEKLKRDQLQAALWDRPDEQLLARKEEEERRLAELTKASEKSTRKQLAKREKQYDYLDSDPENPYITESESDTDSETERQQAKEEAEKKAAEQNGKAVEGGAMASGTSTKANTPSGNHKANDGKSKKRPGSPNLSEASGNESSRKKHKKKHSEKLADGTRKSTLGSFKGAGSGSDSEMTDAGKKRKKDKKEKNRIMIGNTPSATPGASRAGSPAAGNGSRAASPTTTTTAAPARQALPSAREIYDSLPPQGMNIQNLIAKFKGRVDKTNTQMFIKLVKAVSSFDKAKSWLTPLPAMPSDEHISAYMTGGSAPKTT